MTVKTPVYEDSKTPRRYCVNVVTRNEQGKVTAMETHRFANEQDAKEFASN